MMSASTRKKLATWAQSLATGEIARTLTWQQLEDLVADLHETLANDSMEELARVGDLVQLDPTNTANPMFAACIMTVTAVKSWGVVGYVQGLGEAGRIGGQAYYRAQFGTFEKVGRAAWVEGSEDEAKEEAK